MSWSGDWMNDRSSITTRPLPVVTLPVKPGATFRFTCPAFVTTCVLTVTSRSPDTPPSMRSSFPIAVSKDVSPSSVMGEATVFVPDVLMIRVLCPPPPSVIEPPESL